MRRFRTFARRRSNRRGRRRTQKTAQSYPPAHRPKFHSTNPIECVNGEMKRRIEVIGFFPNDGAIIRLAGEWAVQRARYMTLETWHL